jgi:hypothetical protein
MWQGVVVDKMESLASQYIKDIYLWEEPATGDQELQSR